MSPTARSAVIPLINGGAGIYSFGFGTATIKSSIIALNTTTSGADPDVDGNTNSFISAGFNLIGKNDGAAVSFPAGNPNANNDIVGTAASPELTRSSIQMACKTTVA